MSISDHLQNFNQILGHVNNITSSLSQLSGHVQNLKQNLNLTKNPQAASSLQHIDSSLRQTQSQVGALHNTVHSSPIYPYTQGTSKVLTPPHP